MGELKKIGEDFNDPEGNKGYKKYAMNYFNDVRPPLWYVDDAPLSRYVIPSFILVPAPWNSKELYTRNQAKENRFQSFHFGIT